MVRESRLRYWECLEENVGSEAASQEIRERAREDVCGCEENANERTKLHIKQIIIC